MYITAAAVIKNKNKNINIKKYIKKMTTVKFHAKIYKSFYL